MERLGATQKKILLVLIGGLALGMTRSPHHYYRILRSMRNEWKRINKYNVTRSVKSLLQAKLITEKHNSDGSVTLILTSEGRRRATLFQQCSMQIKQPKRWDRCWRIVLFDIPEKKRMLRNIFRSHLKNIGFYEFQKSVFIFPHDCEKEMKTVIKLYEAKSYIRFIQANHIDNESELRRHFSLK